MVKYRIGRLVEPWSNKTPPIRGGVFTDPAQSNAWDSDAELSDGSTICASSVSSGSTLHSSDSRMRIKGDIGKDGEIIVLENNGKKRSMESLPRRNERTEAYIQEAIQAEVMDNIKDYPSLDPQTQREIEDRYKDLHEQVKAGGYYDCHFREYAKELTRYVSIFALFMTALSTGWYWTSAALLGLFWVCLLLLIYDWRLTIL